MAAISGPADWVEFTQESSVHGLRFFHIKTVSIIRRILWGFMTVGMISFFGFCAYGLVKDFVDVKLITKVTVERAHELQFPTITICNQNMWTISALNGSAVGMGSNKLFEIFEDLYGIDAVFNLPPPAGKYDWVNDPFLDPIASLSTNDTEIFLKEAAHKLNNTITRCKVQGRAVDCLSIFSVVATDGGFCFQYNGDGAFNSSSPGKTGGIQVTLDANVAEYATGPNSMSEGFSLVFHNYDDVPQVTELGVGLSPGVQASFALERSSVKRYPPYADGGKSNCFDTLKKPNPLVYYTSSYSYSACVVECKTRYVINKCNCRDPLQPSMSDTDLCLLPVMLNCSQPAILNFAADPDGLASCDCADPCIEDYYNVQVSTYKLPSRNYIALQSQNYTSTEEMTQYTRDNIIVADIFYRQMSYQSIVEGRAIEPLSLISNIGGTLGLCVGASLLTLYEFIEYIFLRLVRCCQRKDKVSKVDTVKKDIM